jgi:pimeloyl-ACP methyl ester carboxylesterase
MKESVHKFGDSIPIFGVLTEPDESWTNGDLPTILLLNAGLLGRVGPFRLHVILARELAKIGFRTFRIDLSGIGDSGRHQGSRPREEQHLGDICSALEYLENELGANRFVVMGICTGADNAHRAMREDERVVGAVCVDGYSYRTLRFYANHYLPKLVSLKSWKSLLKRISHIFAKPDRSEFPALEDDQLDYRWKLPAKEQTESDYREFIRRGARLLCVFTGGWRYNYRGQLADAFRPLEFDDTISTTYLPNASHTFKVEEDRSSLIEAITSWLRSNWSPAK